MAIEAVHNVFYLPLKPGLKLTLAVLAEHSDESGICWPSQKLLSIRTSISIRKVRGHLRSLESAGWLITYLGHGPRSVNLYQLNVDQIENQANFAKEGIKQDKKSRVLDLADPVFATPDSSDINADFENSPSDESDNNSGPTGPTEASLNRHIKTKKEMSLELSEAAKLQKAVTVSKELKLAAKERLFGWAEFEDSDDGLNSHQYTSLQKALSDACSIIPQEDLLLYMESWEFLDDASRTTWKSRISESYQ